MMWSSKFAMFYVVAAVVLCPSLSHAYFAPDSFFDVFLESVSSPPAPSLPTKTWVMNQFVDGGPLVATSELNLSLGESTAGMGATTLSMADSPSGKSANGDVKPNYIAPDSFFDVFLESYDPSHGDLPIVGTPVITPDYMAPDSFFDVFLECVGPVPGTTQTFNLRCEAADGLLFSNVVIRNLNGVAGRFDLCGELDLAPGSNYVQGTSAMAITVTGGIVPEPSTLVLLISSGIGLTGWRRRRT